MREQDPWCHLTCTQSWTPTLGLGLGEERTWAWSRSVKASPPGMRNPCSKMEDRWEVLKLFHLQRFPQNKTSWVLPKMLSSTFLRAFCFFQESPPKMVTKLSYFPDVLQWAFVLICFFCHAGIFLEEVCWGHLFQLWGFFSGFRRCGFKIPSKTTLKSWFICFRLCTVSLGPAWKFHKGWSLLCYNLICWQSALLL